LGVEWLRHRLRRPLHVVRRWAEDRTTDKQRRAVRAEEKAKAPPTPAARYARIEGATGAIRRTMVERYKIEF